MRRKLFAMKRLIINGYVFFDLTEEKLRSYGMKGGPAVAIVKFAKGD